MMKPSAWIASAVVAAVCFSMVGPAVAAEPAKLSFNRDVRPILSENCFACHGFDAKKRQADLRLDVHESALAPRDGAPAIKPGDPEHSEVWKRIASTDADVMMPPPASHKKLTDAQKQTLRRWIEQGAPYQKHWAFEPPVKQPAPAVADKAWPRNDIDRFILKRLEQENLKPLPEASPETLIRRVAFALTGLPPTVAEVDAYLADKSPDAYEKMVDRYLASPRFGEEMARHWLDVARYADTHGLHLDNERQMWAYRDWVIKAFNENLPFDDFTVWQLAGDQLPEPTLDQLVATGFNRCNVTTSEGGSIAEEFLYRYAVERAGTTMQTWMGLTGGCAVCHDHKYDPLTAKEFYSFYAFFYSAADPAMDGNSNTTPPFIKLPRPELKAAAEAAGKVERTAREWLDVLAASANYADPAEAPTVADEKTATRAVRDVLIDDALPPGTTTRNTSRNAVDWIVDPKFDAPSGRRVIRQLSANNFNDNFEFKLHGFTVPQNPAIEFYLRADPIDVPKSITFTVSGAGNVTWNKTEGGLARSGEKTPSLVPGRWTKFTLSATDLGLKPGTRLPGISMSQQGGIAYWDAISIVGESDLKADPLASFAAWKKLHGKTAPPEVPGELNGLFRDDPKKPLTADETAKLRRYYLAVVARPINEELAAARTAWETARTAKLIADDAAPGTFIFRDVAAPREAFVMVRGQYDKPGEKVEPGVPAILPALKKAKADDRATRLDLARWLVSPEHPLTARVHVNRLWQQIFGTGLVKTSFDFGSQGEVPSHPELLDWLAVEFRTGAEDKTSPLAASLSTSPWNTKRLIRQFVTSATFRQQSVVTPELFERDPENRLLARGPRFRLDAEQIRDNALFTSGLIDLTMGGEGVKTYQPPNIWEPVGYSDSNTRYYLQDHGQSLYRRSVYAFLKRTAPPPFMSNFDGPNREQFCSRRERSNTPLQALQLMNDVQHFEAARALAERAIAEGGKTADDRIAYLYRTVLARRPEKDELELVRHAFETQLKLFRAEPKSAEAAIRVGESSPRNVAPAPETAAWTLTANLILNLDETLNRN